MTAISIADPLVTLRPLTEKHINDDMVRWYRDPAVTGHLVRGGPDITRRELLDQYRRDREDTDDLEAAIFETATDRYIGLCGLHGFDSMASFAECRLLIGETSVWGCGLGTAAVRLLLVHGFEALGLNKIWLGVNVENKAATRVYEKAGFVREGVLRQEIFLHGRFIDAVRMSMLRREYLKAHPAWNMEITA